MTVFGSITQNMKLSINKSALNKAISDVSGVVSTRTTLPILGNVCINTTSTGIRLTCTDLDIQVTANCHADVSAPGSTTLPAKRLQSIIKDAPTETIEIETSNDVTTITSGSARYKLNGLAASEFPRADAIEIGATATYAGSDIARAIRMTQYAMSVDESRYVLCGILIEMSAEGTQLVATDGRRLAVKGISAGQVAENVSAIIPAKTVHQIIKAAESSATVEMTIGIGGITVSTAGLEITSKLIEGNYPNWRQVLPSGGFTAVTVGREDMISAVRRVGLLSDARTNQIKFAFTDQSVSISSSSPDVGEASESVTMPGYCPDMTLALNPEYVRACLSALSDDNITLELRGSDSPACIVSDQFRYVIMPMRAAQ